MKLYGFLLICTLIPFIIAASEKNVQSRFSRVVFEFSVKLLSRTIQDQESHFVTSPLSIWSLLATASLGASDTTLTEIKTVLGLQKQKSYNYKFLQLANSAVSNSSEVVIERSSSIFADDRIEILNEIKEKILEVGTSKIDNIPFDNPELAAQQINDYTRRATHDTVDDIVSPGDIENALVIMIDAIYFKGAWRTPFPYSDTQRSPFYNEREAKIGEVNLMSLSDASVNIRYLDNLEARVLELPYGKDDRYSMLFILPDDYVTLYTVTKNLERISLKTIFTMFKESGESTATVQIPRFKIKTDLSNLKELLIDMGLKAMFDSSEAHFPLLSDYPLYVSSIIQKADIEVTEEGTAATAASKAQFSFRTIPEEFIANKPFLYMIIDKTNMVPLFSGAYSKPSVY